MLITQNPHLATQCSGAPFATYFQHGRSNSSGRMQLFAMFNPIAVLLEYGW